MTRSGQVRVLNASNIDFENLANKYNKKIIVFLLGDSNEKIYFKSSIIFRMSQYKTSLNKNEFIMPAYAQDLGSLYGVNYREKSEIPTVGQFIGLNVVKYLDFGDIYRNVQSIGESFRDNGSSGGSTSLD
jgi:hypothetical protein